METYRRQVGSCTSAGLFHMDELVCKAHDLRILLLAHISEEMEQRLLQISWFGVTQLIGRRIDLKMAHWKSNQSKVFNVCMCCRCCTLFCLQICVNGYRNKIWVSKIPAFMHLCPCCLFYIMKDRNTIKWIVKTTGVTLTWCSIIVLMKTLWGHLYMFISMVYILHT